MGKPLRLGDHCLKIGSGATPRGGKDSYLEAGPYRLIRSQNVYNSGFSHDGLVYISDEQAAALNNVEVLPGDILLNITGDSVARSCQVDASVLPARVNQHVAIIRPNPSEIDPRFLRFFLISPAMQSLMLAFAGAGATRNALTKGMIENFVVPKFHIEVQREIGRTLGALEDKIELSRRTNDTLENMMQAIFKNWFMDFGPTRAKMEAREPYLAPDLWALFPDRLDGDTGLPEGWESEPIYDQAEWVNGAAYKNMHFSDEPGALPVVKIAELKSGITSNTKFTNTALGDKYRIDSGDLLFSWSGNPDTSIDAFVWSFGPAWLNQHIFAVRENGKMTKACLYALLKSYMPDFAEIARNKQTTGLGHVTKSDMQRLKICKGPRQITEHFENVVQPIFSKLVMSLFEIRELTKTLDMLLPKLLSGEIRLRDAEKVVGEAL